MRNKNRNIQFNKFGKFGGVQWVKSQSSINYQNSLDWMLSHVKKIQTGDAKEIVWLLEHEDIYTAGTSAKDKDFNRVLLIDDLSDTGLTLNKSIEWLKNYGPTKKYIKEVKTACLWKKKSSSFEPDFCPVKLDYDPWIVQPTEHYEEISIEEIINKNK